MVEGKSMVKGKNVVMDGKLPEKVGLLYHAVIELLKEGEDMNAISVSVITKRAGIGKGTAYDYFDSREEMIASALTFEITFIMDGLKEKLKDYESFSDKVNYFLDFTEERFHEQECFIRFVHLMTDKSAISRRFQECMERMGEEDNPAEERGPMGVIKLVLEQGISRGEVRQDLPMEYMTYAILSRIVTYIACFTMGNIFGSRAQDMREYIYKGILEELAVR